MEAAGIAKLEACFLLLLLAGGEGGECFCE